MLPFQPAINALGIVLGPDIRVRRQADATFLNLVRDRQVLNAMLREVAGETTAYAHLTSTAKVQRKVIPDSFSGEGCPKTESWPPRWLVSRASSYRE